MASVMEGQSSKMGSRWCNAGQQQLSVSNGGSKHGLGSRGRAQSSSYVALVLVGFDLRPQGRVQSSGTCNPIDVKALWHFDLQSLAQ